MKKTMLIFDILTVSAFGVLLHFLFDWSGENSFVGLFSAVNESIWEHQKLLFWPTAVVSIIEYYALKKPDGFLLSRFVATILGMLFIIVVYYTFTGVVGKNIDAFNIALFYIAVIFTFLISRIFEKNHFFTSVNSNKIALIGFLFVALMFFVFTKNPPKIGLFKEP